ncbi:Mu transposase domain-containing protein [Thioclava sp. FR2]|uniref:Mu transposase domain-containing protein n=1 Tax=Thioclava sp. FR2 TaxID=3445780 RepID=UPI003EBDA461
MPLQVVVDCFFKSSKQVSQASLFSFERNCYSLPASNANRPVSVRIYPDWLAVAAEGNKLCENAQVIQRSHHLPAKIIGA